MDEEGLVKVKRIIPKAGWK